MSDPTKVLILRTCTKDMRGTHEKGAHFVWPESGPVTAPDWNPEPECGHGLHGLLWGEGDPDLLSAEPDARWLVVEVEAGTIVDLGRKVKFPSGVVVHCGDRLSATTYLMKRAPGHAVVYGTSTSGDGGTSTSGDRGTSTSGDGGTSTSGYGGILNIRWWDGKRYRIATFYVGEDGIEPNQPYRVDDHGKPVKVEREVKP